MTGWEEQLAKLTPAKRALLERMRKPAPAIPKRLHPGPSAVSFAQQRLWVVHRLDPDSHAFNVPRGLRLQGPLNIPALEAALNEIVRRHQVLRTVFLQADGELLQTPAALPPVRLVPEPIDPSQAIPLGLEEFQRPFDLAHGPLLRARLWHLGEADHILLLVMHHIVSDAWTAAILFDELNALYAAFSQDRPSPLPELAIQYADYAAWQRDSLSGERLDREVAFWLQHLEAAPPALKLPLDSPRPPLETSHGAREVALLPLHLLESLRELSRQEGATLFMTMLAAYSLLLARYSGQEDIVVGTDFSTRANVETEKLIGFFINLLPLRTRVSPHLTFRQAIARAKQAAVAAYSHPEVPFEKLVESLQPERVPNLHPIVQVLLVMQNIPRPKRELAGLQVSEFELPIVASKFDLAVFLEEKPEGLSCQWVYHASLFTPATMQKMARHFQTLLESAVADPGARVDSLAMFSPSELREREETERKARQSKFKRLMTTIPVEAGAPPAPKPSRIE